MKANGREALGSPQSQSQSRDSGARGTEGVVLTSCYPDEEETRFARKSFGEEMRMIVSGVAKYP